MKRKPKNYWTFEKIIEEALKHKYRNEFSNSSYQAYDKARVNGWLDVVCAHMNAKVKKPSNFWCYETCKQEALKYNSKKEFYTNSPGAYGASNRNKWTQDICAHMIKN